MTAFLDTSACGTGRALRLTVMPASYEVCLLTSPVRDVLPALRHMIGPLHRVHHSALDWVELLYSDERDALLLRLRFSNEHTDRRRQSELVQDLSEGGFDVLESSEFSESKMLRFEDLLREQYEIRVQQYPSAAFPAAASRLLDSLEAHLEPVSSLLVGRPETIDASDHIIAAFPMFEVDVEGSLESIETGHASSGNERLRTVQDMLAPAAELPLRMETFGPLDDMIAKLPRAKTQDSLDAALEALWPQSQLPARAN